MKLAAAFIRDGLNALSQRNQKRNEQRNPVKEPSTPTQTKPRPSSGTPIDSEVAKPYTNLERCEDVTPQPSTNSTGYEVEPKKMGDTPSIKAGCNITELAQALRTLYPIPSHSKRNLQLPIENEIPLDRRDSRTASIFPDKASSSWMRSSELLSQFLIEYIDIKTFFRNRSVFENCATICSDAVVYTIEVLRSVLDDDTESKAVDGRKEEAETVLGLEEERRTVDLLRLLRIFSRIEAVSKTLSQQSGITLLTKLIRQYPFTAAIQTECSAVLANLASHAENRTVILDQGCIGLLLETMQRFKDSVSVQTEVCAALANLGCRGHIGKSILSQNGCALITDSMRLHILSAEMQIQGFHALSSIAKGWWAKGNDGGGGVPEDVKRQVILAMRKHQWNPDVMSAACSAVGCLSIRDNGLGTEKDQIMRFIFLGLSRFRHCAAYIIAACFALAHFSFAQESETDLLKRYNGISYILDAMKVFPYHENLQTTALFALGSIVVSRDDARAELLEKGGITVMLQSMGRNYGDAQDKQNDGYTTPVLGVSVTSEGFGGLPEASEPVLYTGNEDGKLQPIAKHLLLQMFASVALLNLGENAKCKVEVLRLGGIHYIFNAAQMVHDYLNLRYVIYYVFGKFAGLDTRSTYMRSTAVPSLGELCRCSVMDQIAGEKKRLKSELKGDWEAEEEAEEEEVEAQEEAFRNEVIDELPLPGQLKEQLKQGKECVECGKACFESSLRKYDMRARKVQSLCSIECGKVGRCEVIAYEFPPE